MVRASSHTFLFFALGVMGAIAQEPCDEHCQIATLIAQVRANGDTSWRAASQLGRIGAPAIPALLEVLADRTQPSSSGMKYPARFQAASAVGLMEHAALPAVPALLAVLRDRTDDEDVRSGAASALGSIGEEPEKVVPALAEALRETGPHRHGNLRSAVIWALAAFGPRARAAIPALRKAGDDGAAALMKVEGVSTARRAQEPAVRRALVDDHLRRGVRCRIDEPMRFRQVENSDGTTSFMLENLFPQPTKNFAPCTREELEEVIGESCVVWLSDKRTEITVRDPETRGLMQIPIPMTEYFLARRHGHWVVARSFRPSAI
jgi:hypothetical protein